MNELARTIAVETSCDETAVAVVGPAGEIEVSLLSSQIATHAPFGGVVPELASREHLKALPTLMEQVMERCPGDLELVAVTAGPGLIGALLVGVRFAAAFAWSRGLPLVAVDHLQGHQVSAFLRTDGEAALEMPPRVLALVASGGHSSWFLITDGRPQQLSRTRDDAAGESFDKVAQVMGLPYPGGPVIDRLARRGKATAVRLPRPRLKDSSIDFSFSGLKSAAIRWLRENEIKDIDEHTAETAACDFLASFELAVVDQLLKPLPELIHSHQPDLVVAAGGVAANSGLRNILTARCAALGIDVRLPPLELTTDNAAMIARAGQLRFSDGTSHDPRRLDAHSSKKWQPPGMRRRGF